MPSRERFLTELTLDPPSAAGGPAGPPHKDEDYLILSTIHSAKGQEWKAVFVLNLVDGCIPSDMATDRPENIEEERRLLYVAMTRARDRLDLLQPERFYVTGQPRHGDRHVRAPRSRFLPNGILHLFEQSRWALATAVPKQAARHCPPSTSRPASGGCGARAVPQALAPRPMRKGRPLRGGLPSEALVLRRSSL